MRTWLTLYIPLLVNLMMARFAEMPAAEPEKKKLPVWVIVLIVVAAVLCLIPICVVVILALLGPAIDNVFSNIILAI